MAIIDTSKGVRPCVEELARLENGKNLFGKTSNLIPTWLLEGASDFTILKNGYTSHGVTYKYEGCGIFSTTGTYDGWQGNVYFNFPLSIHEPQSFNIVEKEDDYTINFSSLLDCRGYTESESEFSGLVYLQLSVRVPLTDNTYYSFTSLHAANIPIPMNLILARYTLRKDTLTEGVTPIFDDIEIYNARLLFPITAAVAPAGVETKHKFSLRIYPLSNYLDANALTYMESIPNEDRYSYLYARTNILQQSDIDALAETVYTLSNNSLQINNTQFVENRAPITNIYHLPSEGE